MQAITVKPLPATDYRDFRWSARASAGFVVVPSDTDMSIEANECAAAEQLCRKFDWKGTWLGGHDHNGNAVFVCSNPRGPLRVRCAP